MDFAEKEGLLAVHLETETFLNFSLCNIKQDIIVSYIKILRMKHQDFFSFENIKSSPNHTDIFVHFQTQ